MEKVTLKTLEELQNLIGETVSIDGGDKFGYLNCNSYKVEGAEEVAYLYRIQNLATIAPAADLLENSPFYKSAYFVK